MNRVFLLALVGLFALPWVIYWPLFLEPYLGEKVPFALVLVGLSSCLLADVVRLFFRRSDASSESTGRLLGVASALLWITHPILLEAVSMDRVMLEMTFTTLLAVNLALRAVHNESRTLYFLCGLAMFAEVIFSHGRPLAPFIVLLVSWVLPNQELKWPKRIWLVAFASVLVAFTLLPWTGYWNDRVFEPPTASFDVSISEFIATQPFAWTKALGQLFFPHPVGFKETMPPTDLVPAWAVAAVTVFLILALAHLVFWNRSTFSLLALCFVLAMARDASMPLDLGDFGRWEVFSTSFITLAWASAAVGMAALTFAGMLSLLGGERSSAQAVVALVISLGSVAALTTFKMAIDVGDGDQMVLAMHKEFPSSAMAYRMLSLDAHYNRPPDVDAALDHARYAVSLRPRNADLHKRLAEVYLTLNEHDEAFEAYRTASRLEPQDRSVALKHSELLVDRDRVREAEEVLRRSIRSDEAWNDDTYIALGFLMLKQNRWNEALEAFEKAIDDAILPSADMYFGLGSAQMVTGQTEAARESFRQAIELRPQYSEAHYSLAALLALTAKSQDDRQAAMYHVMQAIEANPRNVNARVFLGNNFMLSGRPTEAAEQYRIAIDVSPENTQARYSLATALIESNRYAEAISHLEETIRREPDWVDAALDLGWIRASLEDPTLRDGNEALAIVERLLAGQYANNPHILDLKAAALAEVGRFDEAEDTAVLAINRAIETGREDFALDVQDRLRYYNLGQPYRIRQLWTRD
jgi:tetratricopeptide (TPR) repeat protein